MFGFQVFQKGRALVVLMGVLSISSSMAQPPGPPPPPPPPREGFAPPPPPVPEGARTALGGVVRSFNYGLGGLDGLVLDRGQVVHFPPEYANGIARLAPVGASVSVSGWSHTGPAGDVVFDADSITNQRTGSSLAVSIGLPSTPPGPPGPGRGPAPPPPPPPPAPGAWGPASQPPVGPAYFPAAGPNARRAADASLSGTIISFNYGLDGQINGLILSDGTPVYFPPDVSSQIASAVQVGVRVTVTGWPRTGPAGNRLIDAQTITNRRTGATVTMNNSAPPPPGP